MQTTHRPVAATERYRPVDLRTIERTEIWDRLPSEVRESVDVVARVLPFRTNRYVLDELVDWNDLPGDSIFQLTFPQRGMLDPEDYALIRDLLRREAPKNELARAIHGVRMRLNPHPAGQLTHNVPTLDGRPLPGLQHKYDETVLFFPRAGQTCHAYCTYCFRWAQFVDMPGMKFEAGEATDLIGYLHAHHDVTDVLFTGGDPMIMKTAVLRRYVEPLLAPAMESVRHVRFGTKALAYWPQRFVTDRDADDLLELFERVVESGRHVAVMAHFSHPRELATRMVQEAIRRIRATGAEIRVQAPVVRHVNDRAEDWAAMWRESVRLGMVPYYMFVERDTGPKRYFEVPLARAQRIFRDAYRGVSGLARTVRGPSMSAFPGKVRIAGEASVDGRRAFVLEFLQAREPDWVGRPFFARWDESATWLDDLEPIGADRFFFEDELGDAGGLSPARAG